MENLSRDQRALMDYLADRVADLVRDARACGGFKAGNFLAEAEELAALRAGIATRHRNAESAPELQLSLDIRHAA